MDKSDFWKSPVAMVTMLHYKAEISDGASIVMHV